MRSPALTMISCHSLCNSKWHNQCQCPIRKVGVRRGTYVVPLFCVEYSPHVNAQCLRHLSIGSEVGGNILRGSYGSVLLKCAQIVKRSSIGVELVGSGNSRRYGYNFNDENFRLRICEIVHEYMGWASRTLRPIARMVFLSIEMQSASGQSCRM